MKISSECIFYIVRHGETEWNAKKIIQGQSDISLTNTGIDQARALKNEFKHIHFHAAFSSDLERAHHTAAIALEDRKLTIRKRPDLRERNFGKWEGKPFTIWANELKEMTNEFSNLPDEKKKKFKFPDMETDEEVILRFITFLKEVSLSHKGKTIFVATHGSIMRATLIHLGLGTYNELLPGAIANTAYVKIVVDDESYIIHETKRITITQKDQ